MKVQLAAALLQIPGPDGKPAIPYEHAKQMTADMVISLFARDHYPIRYDDAIKQGVNPHQPWNVTWRFRKAHKDKTAKKDIPEMRKADRLAKALVASRQTVATRQPGKPRKRTGSIPGRKHPWNSGRKLQSRGFSR
jgi:hypothetical protein